MNLEDLAYLSEQVDTINGRRPERLAEVRSGIRRARRRRALGATTGATALAVLAISVAANLPGSDQTDGPIKEPLPTVSPIEEPPGQRTIEADYGPADLVDGLEAFGSATSEPGATELHVNLPFGQTYYPVIAGFCRGSVDLWWVANSTYGQCSPDSALEPTPPVEFQPTGNAPFVLDPPSTDQETSVDMWLTGPLPDAVKRCIVEQTSFLGDNTLECIQDRADVTFVNEADATFGVTAYRHRAPLVVTVLGSDFEAQANLDGTNYAFSHAVVSAPGARRLATYLDVSEGSRLVLVQFTGSGDSPSVLVDGAQASFPADHQPGSAWYMGRGGSGRLLVPPGSHNLTFELPDGMKAAAFLVYDAED